MLQLFVHIDKLSTLVHPLKPIKCSIFWERVQADVIDTRASEQDGHNWSYSKRRRYCHLPTSGRRIFQFRPGSSALPIVTGRRPHLDKADRLCSDCGPDSVADESHVVYECLALQHLRQQRATLFTPETETMRFSDKGITCSQIILDCLGCLSV